jgi:hypothetical protein
MTKTLRRSALIRLHTLLRTWDRYEFAVHYCAACGDVYDWWLGCGGCGRSPAGGCVLFGLVELIRRRRP